MTQLKTTIFFYFFCNASRFLYNNKTEIHNRNPGSVRENVHAYKPYVVSKVHNYELQVTPFIPANS